MLAVRILLIVSLLFSPLLAQEDEVPFSAEDSYHLEALVLRQQLIETQLQYIYQACYQNYLRRDGTDDIKVRLVEAQRETSTLLDALYENAGLDPGEYSLDLERKVFVLIPQEETQLAENQETDP